MADRWHWRPSISNRRWMPIFGWSESMARGSDFSPPLGWIRRIRLELAPWLVTERSSPAISSPLGGFAGRISKPSGPHESDPRSRSGGDESASNLRTGISSISTSPTPAPQAKALRNTDTIHWRIEDRWRSSCTGCKDRAALCISEASPEPCWGTDGAVWSCTFGDAAGMPTG